MRKCSRWLELQPRRCSCSGVSRWYSTKFVDGREYDTDDAPSGGGGDRGEVGVNYHLW